MAAMSNFRWLLQAVVGGLVLTVVMMVMIMAGCAALAALVVFALR